jgi:hypothetical protein
MLRVAVCISAFVTAASVALSAAASTPHGPPFAFGGVGAHGAYTVSIAADGSVHATGDDGLTRAAAQLPPSRLVAIDRRATLARFGGFPNLKRCSGATARSTTWIRIGSKKVTVVGTCLPAYQRLWKALVAATDFYSG